MEGDLCPGGFVTTMADRKRVIVLDDDASMLTAVERVLKLHGFQAEVFDTVADFFGHAHLREACCLVLDINLGGHCGIAVRKQLARDGIPIPVIFITAVDDKSTKEAALQAGCIAFLHKPFPTQDLIEAIEQVA